MQCLAMICNRNQLAKLRVLDLSHNKRLQTEGVDVLFKFLSTTHIHTVKLISCNLGNSCTKLIATHLDKCRRVSS